MTAALRAPAEPGEVLSGYKLPPHLARSAPTAAPGGLDWLRRICLAVSSAILQFPAMFELQQKALNQPTLLRGVIEKELSQIAEAGESFRILDYVLPRARHLKAILFECERNPPDEVLPVFEALNARFPARTEMH